MPSNKDADGTASQRRATATPPALKPHALLNGEGHRRNVIVIGASAGGVSALMQLFAALPARLPAAIGVVLHRGPGPSQLAHVLGRRSTLPVVEPEERTRVKQGVIYLAPTDHHLLFEAGAVRILRGPKEHSTRPAIDPLFRSAAATYGKRVVGVQLTGCGEDGVSGLLHIHAAQGLALAQDPQDASMPSMPLNALRFDHVQGIVPLDRMAAVIAALVNGEAVIKKTDPVSARTRG
jgi:two-component system, chemotaxis family, protein-glutamate methylesterase/glutaminase